MKRFALLLGEVVLSIPFAGCGDSGSSATPVKRAEDSRLPAEVREYRGQERQATRGAGREGRSQEGRQIRGQESLTTELIAETRSEGGPPVVNPGRPIGRHDSQSLCVSHPVSPNSARHPQDRSLGPRTYRSRGPKGARHRPAAPGRRFDPCGL